MNTHLPASNFKKAKKIASLPLEDDGIPVIQLTQEQSDFLEEKYRLAMEDIKAGRFTTSREEHIRELFDEL